MTRRLAALRRLSISVVVPRFLKAFIRLRTLSHAPLYRITYFCLFFSVFSLTSYLSVDMSVYIFVNPSAHTTGFLFLSSIYSSSYFIHISYPFLPPYSSIHPSVNLFIYQYIYLYDVHLSIYYSQPCMLKFSILLASNWFPRLIIHLYYPSTTHLYLLYTHLSVLFTYLSVLTLSDKLPTCFGR